MTRAIRVDSHFHGPPRSGNGGYVCGLVASEHGRPCEVRLRLPPPLDKPLDVVSRDDGSTALLDGDDLVADARDADTAIDIPEPVTLDQAREASERYVGFKAHVFPSCFVCGPDRAPGQGLRIFPGDLAGDHTVSAPWQPDASLADPADDATIRPEFVWAALDCPGAFTNDQRDDGRATVLGSLACTIVEPVRTDVEYVVMGWPMGAEGRKAYAGTAIFGSDGTVHAYGKATWIWIDVPGSG